MTPEFLEVDDVLDLHLQQLARFGGASGLRDRGLLESAVAQPQMTADGEFIHPDVFAMAAAYLFHIVRNHAFVDGNKRTGLLACLVFLDLNDHPLEHDTDGLYRLTLGVADGSINRPEVAETLRAIYESNHSGSSPGFSPS